MSNEKVVPTLTTESRHSDYGPDAGGYTILRFNGEWVGRIDYRETGEKLVACFATLTAEVSALKDGKGWWEVTPAGQKKRYSVNEEEELRIACEEITALKAEIARRDAPVTEDDVSLLAIMLTAMHEGVQAPSRAEIAAAMNALILARATKK